MLLSGAPALRALTRGCIGWRSTFAMTGFAGGVTNNPMTHRMKLLTRLPDRTSGSRRLREAREWPLPWLHCRHGNAKRWCCEYYQELSNAEVAELMEISIEAMESLLSRARRNLRTQLMDDGKEKP